MCIYKLGVLSPMILMVFLLAPTVPSEPRPKNLHSVVPGLTIENSSFWGSDNELLNNETKRYEVIENELVEIKEKYADERRTRIIKMATEFNPEDMYADDDMVITISHLGYIKRTPLTEFRQQGRGGVGAKASAARDEDFIEYVQSLLKLMSI